MTSERLVKRANEILRMGHETRQTSKSRKDGRSFVASWSFASFRAAGLSFLEKVFGSTHPYYTEFDAQLIEAIPSHVDTGEAIIETARDEIAGGWLQSVRHLVSAEMFFR